MQWAWIDRMPFPTRAISSVKAAGAGLHLPVWASGNASVTIAP